MLDFCTKTLNELDSCPNPNFRYSDRSPRRTDVRISKSIYFHFHLRIAIIYWNKHQSNNIIFDFWNLLTKISHFVPLENLDGQRDKTGRCPRPSPPASSLLGSEVTSRNLLNSPTFSHDMWNQHDATTGSTRCCPAPTPHCGSSLMHSKFYACC